MKKKNDSNATCVNCGSRTNYSFDDSIEQRYGYVEGRGQFCFRCSYFGGLLKFPSNTKDLIH
jgi:hypothetical protein